MSQKEEVVRKKTNSPQDCQDERRPAQDLAARSTDEGEVHDDGPKDEDGRMREKHPEQAAQSQNQQPDGSLRANRFKTQEDEDESDQGVGRILLHLGAEIDERFGNGKKRESHIGCQNTAKTPAHKIE